MAKGKGQSAHSPLLFCAKVVLGRRLGKDRKKQAEAESKTKAKERVGSGSKE